MLAKFVSQASIWESLAFLKGPLFLINDFIYYK